MCGVSIRQTPGFRCLHEGSSYLSQVRPTRELDLQTYVDGIVHLHQFILLNDGIDEELTYTSDPNLNGDENL